MKRYRLNLDLKTNRLPSSITSSSLVLCNHAHCSSEGHPSFHAILASTPSFSLCLLFGSCFLFAIVFICAGCHKHSLLQSSRSTKTFFWFSILYRLSLLWLNRGMARSAHINISNTHGQTWAQKRHGPEAEREKRKSQKRSEKDSVWVKKWIDRQRMVLFSVEKSQRKQT